jgi:exosome complex component RRP4
MALLVKEKDVAVPGEALAEGMDYLPGSFTYRLGEKVIAKRLGLVGVDGRAVKLIPLSGRYLPKVGDNIIANVFDITMHGWLVHINSAYNAMLNIKDTMRFIRKGEDLTKYFDIGDYVKAKIVNVTSQNLVDITMKEPGLTKLSGGRIITIGSQKVPRVIGKQGSMVTLIKEKTNCTIAVGQNGIVWVKGENPDNERHAVEAIRKIEAESHISGLTERITAFLDQGK